MQSNTAVTIVTISLFAALSAACTSTQNPEPTLHTFTSGSEGFDTQSHYVDTGAEVVVFDSQFTPDLARALIADIQATTDSPIRYLVITHPNPDKFNGAAAFQEIGARVVASRATADAIPGVNAYKKYYFVEIAGMFTDETYPAQPTVDIVFDRELDLELDGDAAIRLGVLDNAGVSSTQTVASIPALDALVVGDLIHHRAHAWLEGGIVDGSPRPDLDSWRAALGELSVYDGATVYAGRGTPTSVAEAVSAQRAYLDRVESIVADYIDDLGAARDELLGENASQHHTAIAELITAAFPDYALPYMVQYSIYGLATSMAQAD